MLLQKNDKLLNEIVNELIKKYKCHSVILYGSRARGDDNQFSDYDILAVKKAGDKFRIAEKRSGFYLDIFIQSEADLKNITIDHLYMKDAKVLFDKKGCAKKLVKKLNNLKQKKSKPLSNNEIQIRKIWLHKMYDRATAGDIEGNYRRSWLQEALLYEYFNIRKLNIVGGSKECFSHLKSNDLKIYNLFAKSLEKPTNLKLLKKLVIEVSMIKTPKRIQK